MRKLILLSGPTCVGKSTVEKELNKLGVPSVVSYTTRPMRAGEIDGKDYYFLDKSDVANLEEKGLVIQKVEFAGHFYGSTSESLKLAFKSSEVAVIVVEPTGVLQFIKYSKNNPDIVLLPVYLNCNYETLVERLIARYLKDSSAKPDDSNLDAYYWTRLVQQYEAYHDWPTYTNWTAAMLVDHNVHGASPEDVAKNILEMSTLDWR